MKPMVGILVFAGLLMVSGWFWSTEIDTVQAESAQFVALQDGPANRVDDSIPPDERIERANRLDEELNELHMRRDKLTRTFGENNPQVRNLDRMIDAHMAERKRMGVAKHPERPLPTGEQIEHFRMAAKHLEIAGDPDLAHELRRRAEEMDRGHLPRRVHELTEQLEQTRREVQELREQLAELRKQLKNRDDASR